MAEQLAFDAIPEPGPDTAAVVSDMLARYAAHTIGARYSGTAYNLMTQATCSCGWEADEPTRDQRPQWAAVDAHLLPVLPDWERGVCWCGRAMLLSPFGKWTHAADAFMGHDARPHPKIAEDKQ
jgi:hypothetical protein